MMFLSSYFRAVPLARWDRLSPALRASIGLIGSAFVLLAVWKVALLPLGWPPLSTVLGYFWRSVSEEDTYKAFLMTGARALTGTAIGFVLALVLAVLTGRTVLGWIGFFFLLLLIQKIPAVALVHVLVSSRLGIGFLTTITLASTVVLTFTWLVLHHRASTLDAQELFALRVLGFRGWRLILYGLIPHLGSAIGASLRLAMSISLVMVILGEWQGIWSDGSIWAHGLGIQISRNYDSINSQARVLSACLWLGVLGFVMDGAAQLMLIVLRRVVGVDLRR